MSKLVYDLHGVSFAVIAVTELGPAATAIHARLAALPRTGKPAELSFELALAPPGPPALGRPVYELPDGMVVYDDDRDLLHARFGALELRCEPGHGRARATTTTFGVEQAWALSHPLFTLALVELLKRRGLYSLHAGGVCAGERALMLAGGSGSGKSTLTLALARAGLAFLGDDTLFLGWRGGRLIVLGFPDEVDLGEGALGLFPELGGIAATPRRPGWRKRQVRPEHLYGTPLAERGAPSLLVLPRLAPAGAASTLTPLEPSDALLQLIPNVLLTDPSSTQAHLDALAALVAVCDCYRLDTGRDLDSAVATLRRLLEEKGPAA